MDGVQNCDTCTTDDFGATAEQRVAAIVVTSVPCTPSSLHTCFLCLCALWVLEKSSSVIILSSANASRLNTMAWKGNVVTLVEKKLFGQILVGSNHSAILLLCLELGGNGKS
jgi:hypothetical protein